MADLDRYDLDETWRGDCPICGAGIYDIEGEPPAVKFAGELCHSDCVEETEGEMAEILEESGYGE